MIIQIIIIPDTPLVDVEKVRKTCLKEEAHKECIEIFLHNSMCQTWNMNSISGSVNHLPPTPHGTLTKEINTGQNATCVCVGAPHNR